MMNKINHYEGVMMKKTLIIAVMTAMLVFAMAGTAFAKNAVVNWRGDGTTYSAENQPDATLIYNPWTTDASQTADWAADDYAGNAGYSSPHGGYATTTVKCAVCHAVHVASPLGDTLLKMPADQACVSCHVTAQLGGTNMVYGGDAAIAAASGTDHHSTGTNCSYCHATVHGANAITDVPSVVGIILRADMNPRTSNALISAGTAISGLTTAQVDAQLTTDAGAATREVAIGLFCQNCHAGSYQNGVAGTLGKTTATGHRVGASVIANASYAAPFNYNLDTTSTASYTGQVAWAAATNCKSCHDATQFADGTGGLGFPHFTQGAARFLNMAASASDVATRTGVSVSADASFTGTETATYSSGDPMVAEFSLRDGVCLRGHKGDATTGVGQTY